VAEWSAATVEDLLRRATAARRFIEGNAGDPVGADAVAALVRMAACMSLLDGVDTEIVRLRTSGSRWKPICWQLGISRATAHRHYKAALLRVATRLNQHPASHPARQ
jgi:hypothetical protein